MIKPDASVVAPPRSGWLVVVGLFVLCAVPVGAGAWRVTELAGSPVMTDANARFVANPAPAVVHIVTACLFCVLGALQVARAPRLASWRWHRAAGRASAPLGIVAGLSGVWLTLAYWTIDRDGPVLFAMRLVAGSMMGVFIAVGVVRVLRRDVAGHQAWMLRGYGLGVAAGTQFFTFLPWLVTGIEPSKAGNTVAMAAGWLINMAAVEWHLRRQR